MTAARSKTANVAKPGSKQAVASKRGASKFVPARPVAAKKAVKEAAKAAKPVASGKRAKTAAKRPAPHKTATRGAPASAATKKADATRASAKPKLLSGGNPQIPKGHGDAPVQAYIAAMPGWKHDVGRRLDALVARTVPGVRKAVKWNTPLYGARDRDDWFLSFHCFDRYVKVAFLRGASLRPEPPVGSKHPHVRYFHVHEGDAFDEKQFTGWVKQAGKLPGEKM